MDQSSPTPLLVTETPAEIQAELAQRGIGFEQWPALQELPLAADQSWILKAYANEIDRVKRDGGYATVDAIRMTPITPSGLPCAANFWRNTPMRKMKCDFLWKDGVCSACTLVQKCCSPCVNEGI